MIGIDHGDGKGGCWVDSEEHASLWRRVHLAGCAGKGEGGAAQKVLRVRWMGASGGLCGRVGAVGNAHTAMAPRPLATRAVPRGEFSCR